ncbi:MAG: glycosyltransferase family 4 protein [bacterium]
MVEGKERMQTLHLVHQYVPEKVGGTELYTQWLSRAQVQRSYQAMVFYRCGRDGKGIEHRVDHGVDVWSTWNEPLSDSRRFLATWGDSFVLDAFEQVLERLDPDIVHVEHLMGLPVALINALQRRQIPYVITLWDFWWICANAQLLTNYSQEICDGPEAYLNCARCALARAGVRWLLPAVPAVSGLLGWRNRLLRGVMTGAARLIAPTPFVRDWYASHGAPADNLVVAQPALESRATSVARGRGPKASLRFAYIGGLSWQKGVHVLAEAFSRLRGAAELWIAGDETFDPKYTARLRAEATPNVKFLGRLSRDDVWKTLAEVDVVAVPSLWYETFSFIVSEAFAAGVPVVASRLGPLADRVRDQVDGLLIPPGDVSAWRDGLQRLVEEPDLLKRLTANVQPPVTLDEHVDQIEGLYRAVLAERR